MPNPILLNKKICRAFQNQTTFFSDLLIVHPLIRDSLFFSLLIFLEKMGFMRTLRLQKQVSLQQAVGNNHSSVTNSATTTTCSVTYGKQRNK